LANKTIYVGLWTQLHIKNDGTFVSQDDSACVWISHHYSGPGFASCDSTCDVALPLDPKALDSLMMI